MARTQVGEGLYRFLYRTKDVVFIAPADSAISEILDFIFSPSPDQTRRSVVY
jgi:hypothetical protein